MDEQKLRQIMREEIANYMIMKQYNISKIPNHEHNGNDTPKLSIASMIESIPVTGTTGGVFDPAILDTQTVNHLPTSTNSDPSQVTTLSVPMIYGFGVGVHSAFNGGLAEEGTMIAFSNGAFSTLWFMMDGTWRGVGLNLTA